MTEPATWQRVARALLGSWPERVASWGEEGIAAFVEELQARGIAPEAALVAIRSCPADQKFPPSAPELAALARQDPSKPTFAEAVTLIRKALRAGRRPLTGNYGSEAEMIGAREQLVRDAADGMHPLVSRFVARYGVSRLQDDIADLDGDFGAVRARDLERAWTEHCEAFEGRAVAALASGARRGELGRFDPLAALPEREAAQIGSGE